MYSGKEGKNRPILSAGKFFHTAERPTRAHLCRRETGLQDSRGGRVPQVAAMLRFALLVDIPMECSLARLTRGRTLLAHAQLARLPPEPIPRKRA